VNWFVLPLTVALIGCGDGAEPAQTERRESPELSATPSATPSAPAATATPTPPIATAPSAPVPPEDAPGGAGDEEAARVRSSLVIDGEGITPRRVTVPAFLSLELSVRNASPQEQVVFVAGAQPSRAVSVGPGETRRLALDGLRPGSYRIDAGPGRRGGTLVARGERPPG